MENNSQFISWAMKSFYHKSLNWSSSEIFFNKDMILDNNTNIDDNGALPIKRTSRKGKIMRLPVGGLLFCGVVVDSRSDIGGCRQEHPTKLGASGASALLIDKIF